MKRMEKKVCNDCKAEKPLSAYGLYPYRNRYALASGEVRVCEGVRRTSYCGPCMARRSVAWREANPERFRAYQRAYHRARREKERARAELIRESSGPAVEAEILGAVATLNARKNV